MLTNHERAQLIELVSKIPTTDEIDAAAAPVIDQAATDAAWQAEREAEHARELERIDAQAAATVKVIEAEAAADAAVAAVHAGAAVTVAELTAPATDALEDAGDELGDELGTGDGVELDAGELLDGGPLDDAAEVLGSLEDVATPATDALDEVLPDVPPVPAHWFKRPLRSRSRR
jgi:hypothetical protein